MKLSVRQRLGALLFPLLIAVVGLVLAAVWLGYSLATQLMAHPGQPLDWQELGTALLPALLMLLVLAAVAHLAARHALRPWLDLAHQVQDRGPKDMQPIAMETDAPAEVQVMVRALNRLFDKASAESDAQQRFIADAAHQLRTPLAALQSQVEAWALMAQAAPSKSIVLPAEQVEGLRKASRRTTQLANQLLVLSRVDSTWRQAAPTQRVDLKSLCEAVLESQLDTALTKRLDIGLEAEAAHVTGHEWLLRELIANVLDNAIKYTPADGRVTLRCGRRTTDERQMRAYVEIEDDGPGVNESEYLRLTQRFYRTPGASAEGTGLGLAIAQEIAQGHGAQLLFGKSASGQGLCVTLIFCE
ncbi:MAG: ATP-binding protein [Comamonas sp.]